MKTLDLTAALAATTDEHERSLVQIVADKLPLAREMMEAHNAADRANIGPDKTPETEAAETEAHEAWTAVRAVVTDAAEAILKLPALDAPTFMRRYHLFRDIMVQANYLLPKDAMSADPIAGLDDGEDVAMVARAAMRALATLSRLEQTTPPVFPTPMREAVSRWTLAFAAHEQARKTITDLNDRYDSAHESLVALAAPDMIRPAAEGIRANVLYTNLQQFDHQNREPLPHQLEAKQARNAARNIWEAFFARADVKAILADIEALGDQLDAALDVADEKEVALIRTPAPDIDAVMWKQARLGYETDDDKKGYTDRAFADYARHTGEVAVSWPLHIYADMLRLTGQSHPMMDRDTFDPYAWLKAFKAEGGRAEISHTGRGSRLSLAIIPAEAEAPSEFPSDEASRLLGLLKEDDNRKTVELAVWNRS